MSEALVLTIMGMGVVFVVLGLIYGAIVFLGVMDRLWPQHETVVASVASASPSIPSGESLSSEEEAAVVAAFAQYLNRAPNTFSIRIHHKK